MNTDAKYDLFFSYNHDSTREVKELYHKLKEHYGNSLRIWIDFEQWVAGVDSDELLMKGLKQSNCIICFITKKYSQSVVCKRELSFALEKPHAILMLEHYNEIEDAVQFKIKIDSRLNFYWNKEKPSMWVGEEYEKLLKTISPYIIKSSSQSRPASSRQENQARPSSSIQDSQARPSSSRKESQARPTSSKQVSLDSSKTETTSNHAKKSNGEFRIK